VGIVRRGRPLTQGGRLWQHRRGMLQTKVVGIKIHTPGGVIELDLDKVLAMMIEPYPVIVMKKNSDGKFIRYSNFPIEFVDEETLLVSAPGANGAAGQRRG
jgi:hypothetical protein